MKFFQHKIDKKVFALKDDIVGGNNPNVLLYEVITDANHSEVSYRNVKVVRREKMDDYKELSNAELLSMRMDDVYLPSADEVANDLTPETNKEDDSDE